MSSEDSDISPVRRVPRGDRDLSPPRRSKRDEELEEEEEEEETVIRDFDGRAVTEQQLVSRRSRLDEKFESLSRMEWGKGLVQQKMAQSRSAERARGASAPLARYIDDKDLNDELRDKQVWGDPMIRLSSSVKSNARNKRSARPMYKGVPFSNRFGILPGYRWDGIDRSNGWEKKRIGLISDRDTYQQFVHVDDDGGIVLDKIKFVAPLLPRNRENATSNQYSEQMIKRICNLEESEQQIELEVKWEMQVGTGRGLVNMGNTCFLNSVLQCLSYCPPMFNVLYAKVHSKNCLYKDRFCLFCEMEKLAENLFPRSGSKKMPFSPIGIVKNLKAINRKYRLGRQEDAHELLMFVLDSMQNSCKPKVSSTNAGASKRVQAQSRDYISQIFEGKLQNEVKCLNCGYVSCGTESFMDINLQIVGQKSKSVEHALQQFTAVDRLYGENRYRCSKCNQLVDAEKRMVIQSLPNLLTIQLKRFHYDLYGGSKKIEKHVPFEVNIDFAPYLSSSSKCEDTKYELCGLVVHYGGGCRSGHYVSYVKASNGVWNLVDDECVSQIGINSVLKQNAYVLFYSKKASSRVSKKTPEKPEPKFEAKKPEQPSSEIKVDLKDVPKCKELSSTLYLGERLCLPVTSLALPNPIGMKPVFLQSLLSVPIISDSSQESEIMETDTKISSNSSRAPLENIVAEKRSAKSRLLFEERQSNREESTWEGIDCQVELSKKASILQSMPSQPKRKRDSWDILLDQGKEKKIKSSKNSFLSSSSSKLSVNKFQQYLQSKKKKPF